MSLNFSLYGCGCTSKTQLMPFVGRPTLTAIHVQELTPSFSVSFILCKQLAARKLHPDVRKVLLKSCAPPPSNWPDCVPLRKTMRSRRVPCRALHSDNELGSDGCAGTPANPKITTSSESADDHESGAGNVPPKVTPSSSDAPIPKSEQDLPPEVGSALSSSEAKFSTPSIDSARQAGESASSVDPAVDQPVDPLDLPEAASDRGSRYRKSKDEHDWAVLQKRIAFMKERAEEDDRLAARNWRSGTCSQKVVAFLENWVRKMKFAGEVLACGTHAGKVVLFSLVSQQELACFKGHSSEITALDFDGARLVAASEASTFLLWDTLASQGVGDAGTSFRGHTKAVTGLQLDGPHVVSSSEDGTVRRVWQVATGECLHVARAGYPVRCVARAGDTIMMGLANGTVVAYSLAGQRLLRTFTGHAGAVICIQYEAGRNLLVTGSADGSLRAWNSESGECLRTFEGHQFDESKLVSAARDGSIRVWDLASGDSLYALLGYTASCTAVVLEKDSFRL
eukprot:jgi/Mesen1/428/ME000100S10665